MKRILIYAILLLLVVSATAGLYWRSCLWITLALAPFGLVAVHDLFQREHTLLRNYPIFGHIRYLLEDFRHQIRQYFIEGDRDELPFSRVQRSTVYLRAKGQNDSIPFGNLINVYEPGYEWFEHSVTPVEPSAELPRVQVGGEQCNTPYSASLLNISAMSYGALSSNAILALNLGAKTGNFFHDTGEGGMSRYHLKHGGDLVWEIGTGYFGCRTKHGDFDPEQFQEGARREQVKMTELKLSQGAKPGGGGLLPGGKVTPEIAEARGVPVGQTCHSPPHHKVFDTPTGLLEFIAKMREMSGGKPAGFKLCLGKRVEFMAICKAMLETGIYPDFITIDGSEGGTGAAPPELIQSMGHGLRDGLIFAHNALVGAGIRDRMRLICAGKVITGFDIAAKIAMGADMCNSARGMMFALGCIQARACHKNICPTGITTQDPWRVHGLSVAYKAPRVANFHKHTLQHFQMVLCACGLREPSELKPEMLWRRISQMHIRHYRELYEYLEPAELVNGSERRAWRELWSQASSDSFHPATA